MIYSLNGNTQFQSTLFNIIKERIINRELNEDQIKAILMLWGSTKSAEIKKSGIFQNKKDLTVFFNKEELSKLQPPRISNLTPIIPKLPNFDEDLADRLNLSKGNFYSTGQIIIGPPGTGKTFVIVNSSLLFLSKPLNKRGTSQKIAICTSTHPAANRILEGFYNFFQTHKRSFSDIDQAPILIKRIYRKDSEYTLDSKYDDYLLMEFPESSTEDEEHENMSKNARIFIGTIYQVQRILRKYNIGVQMQVFDEASQITPPMAYLPISVNKSIKSFCFIGDDCQLPPISATNRLNMSIINFVLGNTIYNNNILPKNRIILLRIQYRMHPAIRDIAFNFAEKRKSKIEDGENVKNPENLLNNYTEYKCENRTIEKFLDDIFNPKSIVVILDINNLDKSTSKQIGTSQRNEAEIRVIAGLVKIVPKVYQGSKDKIDFLKIISPYKAQIDSLNSVVTTYQVGTVDSFQGQESDVVIFGLTNSAKDYTSSHLTNNNRLHVALSRAKRKLIIILNSSMFDNDENTEIKKKIYSYQYNSRKRNNIELSFNPVKKIEFSTDLMNYLSYL